MASNSNWWTQAQNSDWWSNPSTGSSSDNVSQGGGTGNLTGSAYDYSSTYGGKANVPDPSASAASAISGSSGNLASLYSLGSSLNQYQTGQATAAQEALTPGYTANMDKWASDISDLLAGKVSSGTINTISQQAAERGISSGIAGSQANQSDLLRALGLTSQGLQATGATQLQQMIAASPKVNLFDYKSYLTSPGDVQSAQYAANTIGSAADPATAAQAAQNAALSGVSSGLSAAGSSPGVSGGSSGSSIASLLSSILGGGSAAGVGVGSLFGNSGALGGGNSNMNFNDWYNQVYGAGGATPSASDYTGDESFSPYTTGAGGYETGTYDNTNMFDASAYA